MPENHGEKFRKFFSGFGTHDKSRDEQPPAPDPEPAGKLTSDSPDEPQDELREESQKESREESREEPSAREQPSLWENVLAVPQDNPLAEVWKKCGQPGTPALSSLPWTQDGAAVLSNAMNASLIKILRELAPMSQRWLTMEVVSALAQAQAAAAKPGEASSSQADKTASDGEAPVPAAPPKPPDVDEMAQVLVSQDGMAAWLFLLPPSGKGKQLTLANGQTLLREAHVTAGLDQRAIFSIFTNRPYFRLCPVALGTPPVEGQDGWAKEHFPRNFARAVRDEDPGNVDYRALSCVQSIEKGEVICDIHPPVEGVPGVRVDGVAVPPKAVKRASVLVGSNTVLSEDGSKLLAAIDGFLEFWGDRFVVKNLLNITSDVDYSTGNIDFHGDVTIQGDVREQFSVRSTGNITINGMVEAATVEAEGNVVISAGVSGNNQAVIRGKHVRAKHLESCTVYADCLESDYILASHIFCGDSVVFSGSRGGIIGGQIVAVNRIKANFIGNESGRVTEITLGVQPEIREELLANRKELLAIRDKASELLKRAMYLKKRMEVQGRPDPRSSAEIQAAAQTLTQMTEREKALLARQTELMDDMKKLTKCRLEAGTVHPGVRLTIGSAIRNIETVAHNCTAVFDSEEMDIKFV